MCKILKPHIFQPPRHLTLEHVVYQKFSPKSIPNSKFFHPSRLFRSTLQFSKWPPPIPPLPQHCHTYFHGTVNSIHLQFSPHVDVCLIFFVSRLSLNSFKFSLFHFFHPRGEGKMEIKKSGGNFPRHIPLFLFWSSKTGWSCASLGQGMGWRYHRWIFTWQTRKFWFFDTKEINWVDLFSQAHQSVSSLPSKRPILYWFLFI